MILKLGHGYFGSLEPIDILANVMIVSLTIPIPLSSDAFSSITLS
jgi:hypothetical protein